MAESNTPNVNLLSGRKRKSRKEKMVFAKVQFVALVVAVVYIGLLVVILSIRGYVALQLSRTRDAIEEEKFTLVKLQPLEEKYFLVQSKVALLTNYFNARGAARQALVDIYENLPEGVILSNVDLGDDEDLIEIQALATDVFAMVDYLNLVEVNAVEGVYKKVEVFGIGRSSDGRYTIGSSFYLIR